MHPYAWGEEGVAGLWLQWQRVQSEAAWVGVWGPYVTGMQDQRWGSGHRDGAVGAVGMCAAWQGVAG